MDGWVERGYSMQSNSFWKMSDEICSTVHTMAPEHHKQIRDLIPVLTMAYTAEACDQRTNLHHTVSYRATSWGFLNLLGCRRLTPRLKTLISSHEDHKKACL